MKAAAIKLYETGTEKVNILNLLDEEISQEQYLDLGFTENAWWFGFKIKGKDAILLSNGEVLRNTLETFKDQVIGIDEIRQVCNYKGYIGDIAPTITHATVKTFLTKKADEKTIKPKELYKTIRDKILYYLDFSGKDEIADVLTCWIMATYCYPLFYWFPHILFNAPSQSGKTKCAFTVMQLSFRGFDLGASAGVTSPQMFRTIEGNRGTMLIDEYEQTDKETQKTVNQILNASATRNAYVIRCEQVNKKWKSWKFPIFCPKIVANISGINPTSLSRFIAFKWLKTLDSDKSKRKPFREKDLQSFEQIRNDLYLLILENWQAIKKLNDELNIPELKNREEDNWLPLFTIARFIEKTEGEEVKAEQQLWKFIANYSAAEIETNDLTQEFFLITLEKVTEEQLQYTPKDIAQWTEIQELLTFLKSPAHWVGKTLKSYGFLTNRGGGVRKYILSKKAVQNIIDRYNMAGK